MKYRPLNITRKGDKLFVRFYCPDCIFAPLRIVVLENHSIMHRYDFPEGTLKEEDLPDSLRKCEVHVETIEMKLPNLFLKIYTRDVYDELDQYVVHHKGDIVTRPDGTPDIHEYMDVHCFYVRDPDTNDKSYIFGDPVHRMYEQIRYDGWRYYVTEEEQLASVYQD